MVSYITLLNQTRSPDPLVFRSSDSVLRWSEMCLFCRRIQTCCERTWTAWKKKTKRVKARKLKPRSESVFIWSDTHQCHTTFPSAPAAGGSPAELRLLQEPRFKERWDFCSWRPCWSGTHQFIFQTQFWFFIYIWWVNITVGNFLHLCCLFLFWTFSFLFYRIRWF